MGSFYSLLKVQKPLCSQATLKVGYVKGRVGEGCWGKDRTEDEEFLCVSSNWVCHCDEGNRDSFITLELTRSLAALRKAVSLYTWKKAVSFQIRMWEKWKVEEMIPKLLLFSKGNITVKLWILNWKCQELLCLASNSHAGVMEVELRALTEKISKVSHCLSKWITWDHPNLNSWHGEWLKWVSFRREVKASERVFAYLACIITRLHLLSSNLIEKKCNLIKGFVLLTFIKGFALLTFMSTDSCICRHIIWVISN